MEFAITFNLHFQQPVVFVATWNFKKSSIEYPVPGNQTMQPMCTHCEPPHTKDLGSRPDHLPPQCHEPSLGQIVRVCLSSCWPVDRVTVRNSMDLLDRQHCLNALASLRHAKWFQVCYHFLFYCCCSLMSYDLVTTAPQHAVRLPHWHINVKPLRCHEATKAIAAKR